MAARAVAGLRFVGAATLAIVSGGKIPTNAEPTLHYEYGAVDYRGVGDRCAVELSRFDLPFDVTESLRRLTEEFGCEVVETDVETEARRWIGRAEYRYAAIADEATSGHFDCSSFVKWAYAQRGVWLPRSAIQQGDSGFAVAPPWGPFPDTAELRSGDLVFAKGAVPHLTTGKRNGIGHVGMWTVQETIIQAKPKGVVETSLNDFYEHDRSNLRGARRVIPRPTETFTVKAPPELEIESAQDLYWVLWESAYHNRPPLGEPWELELAGRKSPGSLIRRKFRVGQWLSITRSIRP